MVDLVTNLYDRGLLDTGEYAVIYIDHMTFDASNPTKYFKRKYYRIALSLLNDSSATSCLIVTQLYTCMVVTQRLYDNSATLCIIVLATFVGSNATF